MTDVQKLLINYLALADRYEKETLSEQGKMRTDDSADLAFAHVQYALIHIAGWVSRIKKYDISTDLGDLYAPYDRSVIYKAATFFASSEYPKTSNYARAVLLLMETLDLLKVSEGGSKELSLRLG